MYMESRVKSNTTTFNSFPVALCKVAAISYIAAACNANILAIFALPSLHTRRAAGAVNGLAQSTGGELVVVVSKPASQPARITSGPRSVAATNLAPLAACLPAWGSQ